MLGIEARWGLSGIGFVPSAAPWGSVLISCAAANWAVGRLSGAETVGLGRALDTDPCDLYYLLGLLPQGMGRGWRLPIGA